MKISVSVTFLFECMTKLTYLLILFLPSMKCETSTMTVLDSNAALCSTAFCHIFLTLLLFP
ncbi:hypothetical protein BKA69DRAFT_1082216 [Paraphysoderma sedebokerense]|nr:hypothetical protein BKA69DRAFT_1082216 [Paraphysoderma sedebokerense]